MFYSKLKGECSQEFYNFGKDKYEYHLNLNETHPDKWWSFLDYLKFYNINDVVPTSLALRKCFTTFKEVFAVEMMDCYGLPSFAQKSLFSLYN